MRLKSIFQKLLLYTITVNLIGMVLLSVIMNYSLNELLYKKKEAALFHQTDQLITILKQAPLNNALFNETVDFNQKLSKVKMALLPKEGQAQSPQLEKQENKRLKRGDIDDPQIISDVFSGQRITHIGKFEKKSNKDVVTVGVPLKDNGKIIGALFLYTPVKEVQTADISKVIWLVSIIITLLAILALFWISRKMTNPLVRISHAARSIGQGNFKERISVESEDEVGQLALTFNDMVDQLEKLENMRKELIRNVSHELRTPLTSVRGFIQGLLEGVIPPSQQEKYLTISFQEIQRLSNLLNTMLDLSAIESGRVTLKPVMVHWDALVGSIIESIRPRVEEKQITLIHTFDESEPLFVLADPERIKQVLFNLLDNAVRHTPINGTIEITSRKHEEKLEVSVFNSGSGILEEKLPYIWEPFYTEDFSRQSHRERSGLGLPITRQLIELMGGNISAISSPGHGVIFTFLLPNSSISQESRHE